VLRKSEHTSQPSPNPRQSQKSQPRPLNNNLRDANTEMADRSSTIRF
jgi:hypothetical protein